MGYNFLIDIIQSSFPVAKKYDINNYRKRKEDFRGKKQKIPFIIHQTHENSFLSPADYVASASLINMNSDYSYRFYDSTERRNFIKDNFLSPISPYKETVKGEVLAAYDSLIPGAYKADLFRLCMLYIQGGIYIDCKSTTIVPFNDMFSADDQLVMFTDVTPTYLMNGFIASIPGHPFICRCIKEIVNMVNTKNYGINPLAITGPCIMGKVFTHLTGKICDKAGKYPLSSLLLCERDENKEEKKNYTITIIGRLRFFYQYFYDDLLNPLIQRINCKYNPLLNLANRYELRWIFGRVFC